MRDVLFVWLYIRSVLYTAEEINSARENRFNPARHYHLHMYPFSKTIVCAAFSVSLSLSLSCNSEEYTVSMIIIIIIIMSIMSVARSSAATRVVGYTWHCSCVARWSATAVSCM